MSCTERITCTLVPVHADDMPKLVEPARAYEDSDPADYTDSLTGDHYELIDGRWFKVEDFVAPQDMERIVARWDDNNALRVDVCYYSDGRHWTELVAGFLKGEDHG